MKIDALTYACLVRIAKLQNYQTGLVPAGNMSFGNMLWHHTIELSFGWVPNSDIFELGESAKVPNFIPHMRSIIRNFAFVSRQNKPLPVN